MLMTPMEKRDAFGFVYDTEYKRTEFDIEVIPQRENPFTKESNNQTIMNLWNGGFFCHRILMSVSLLCKV